MPNDDRRSGAQVLNSDGAISRARVVRATRRAASTLKVWSQQSLDWLGNLDSNQDKQSQSLLCYRYTIPQWIVEQVQWVMDLLGNRTGGPDRPHRLAALLLAHGRAWQVRNDPARLARSFEQPATSYSFGPTRTARVMRLTSGEMNRDPQQPFVVLQACRLITKHAVPVDGSKRGAAPLKLFLSHTKRDTLGLKIAIAVNTCLDGKAVDRFIDAVSIQPSDDIANQLDASRR